MQFSYPPTVPSPLGVGYTPRFHVPPWPFPQWTWCRKLIDVHELERRYEYLPGFGRVKSQSDMSCMQVLLPLVLTDESVMEYTPTVQCGLFLK